MHNKYPPAIVYENITTTLKWYNMEKGFGFIKLPEKDGDAFLHASQLTNFQATEYPEGMTIICDIIKGQKGLQVSIIHSIDDSKVFSSDNNISGDISGQKKGCVKFFNSDKGFGFITLDDEEGDAFIASRVLERCGLMSIEEKQRVMVTLKKSDKGFSTESIELLE